MSIVLDSSVWIEVMIQAAGWQRFSVFLRRPADVRVPSAVLSEVGRWFLQRQDQVTAGIVVAHLLRHEVVALDAELAVKAARLGVQHRLSLGDSIIYATSVQTDSELITMDAHFEGLPGVRYFAKAAGS